VNAPERLRAEVRRLLAEHPVTPAGLARRRDAVDEIRRLREEIGPIWGVTVADLLTEDDRTPPA
jgi:hypothetical protein